MSCLSLPVDDLNRFHVKIRLPAPVAQRLSLSLQAASRTETIPPSKVSRVSSGDMNNMPSSAYNVHFQTEEDAIGHFLRISSSTGSIPQPCSYSGQRSSESRHVWPSTRGDYETAHSVQKNGVNAFRHLSTEAPQQIVNPLSTMLSNDENPIPQQDRMPTASAFDHTMIGKSDPQSPTWGYNPMSSYSQEPVDSYFNLSGSGGYAPSVVGQERLNHKPEADTFAPSQIASNVDPAFDFSLFDFSAWDTRTTSSSSSGSLHTPTSSCSSFSGETALAPPRYPSSPLPHISPIHSSESAQSTRESTPSSDHDSGPLRRFSCLNPDCSRRFTSQHTLRLHMEAHKLKPRPKFPCTLGCSEKFSRQHDRLRHEVAQHGKICEWLCDECGRFFSSKKTLGIHKCPAARGNPRWVK